MRKVNILGDYGLIIPILLEREGNNLGGYYLEEEENV